MKKVLTTFLLALVLFSTYAQNTVEDKIGRLENDQREAFLKKDTEALYKLLSPEFVVNAPTNTITTLQQLKMLIKSGQVDMEVFQRVTEKITLIENIAIAMGYETLKPTGKMPNAGKTVKRRYSNIWMKKGDEWLLVARQATIISVE